MTKKTPWIAYPGALLQNNYGEPLEHGYLLWNIENKEKYDVEYCELPNVSPFVTLEWAGDVARCVEQASNFPSKTRYRIKSNTQLSQRDVSQLTNTLLEDRKALEVTFKIDNVVNKDVILSSGVDGSMSVAKSDLRNIEVIHKFLNDHYVSCGVKLSDDEWSQTKKLTQEYLTRVNADSVSRNVKWSLKDLKFSNTFGYGEDNRINFSKLSGVTGIFGQNRIGKSSIVGTIMYVLHNDTDRGSIKNIDVINVRKPYCYARAIIDVNGANYVFERQTVKRETKKGVTIANTQLNLFSVSSDGSLVDLNGEQRIDTERLIRDLIGTSDDFLMTSMSTQDHHNSFISLGSSHRKYVLTKFLDLDIFERLHELMKADTASLKAQVKALSSYIDADAQIQKCVSDITSEKYKVTKVSADIEALKNELSSVSDQLSSVNSCKTVSQKDVDDQNTLVKKLELVVSKLESQLETIIVNIDATAQKLVEAKTRVENTDVCALKLQLEAYNNIESSIQLTKHTLQAEERALAQQKRSLKILEQVPCSGSFPTCNFIKDTIEHKSSIDHTLSLVSSLRQTLETQERAQACVDKATILKQLTQFDNDNKLLNSLSLSQSKLETDVAKTQTELASYKHRLVSELAKLSDMITSIDDKVNSTLTLLKDKRSLLQTKIKQQETELLASVRNIGSLEEKKERLSREKQKYDSASLSLKIMEYATNAFSKKGIPTRIINNQLPLINAEIAKTLHGIVDFTIELQSDDDDNSLDVYINYGDSRRLIELGSGMEKMVSSVAIRLALTNVSSLPKSDMFIVDEGFGALDDAGVEAVNRLLQSLKTQFRNIIVISHVDGVKEIADNVLEITRVEKDSRVCYE